MKKTRKCAQNLVRKAPSATRRGKKLRRQR